MNLDLSGIVVAMADTTLSVTRHVSAWGTDGRATETTSSFSAVALVAPRKSRGVAELQGDVSYGSVDVYSVTRLVENDTFTYGGRTYQVDTVAGYEATGNFCVAIARVMP